jgi:hypothetical protein
LSILSCSIVSPDLGELFEISECSRKLLRFIINPCSRSQIGATHRTLRHQDLLQPSSVEDDPLKALYNNVVIVLEGNGQLICDADVRVCGTATEC